MVLSGVLLYGGFRGWVDTRNFSAVNAPITLQTGEVVEQKFNVNISGEYWIHIETSGTLRPYTEALIAEWKNLRFRLEIRNNSEQRVPTHSWDGQPDCSWKGSGSCYADLKSGAYSARLVVLHGSKLLSADQPRLKIEADSTSWYEWLPAISWIAALVTLSGLMLALRRAVVTGQEKGAEEKTFATPPTGSYQPDVLSARVRSERQIGTESQWAVYSYWALCIVLCLFVAWVPILVIAGFRAPHYGWWVRLLLPQEPSSTRRVPRAKIIVNAVCSGRVGEYTINNRMISPEKLDDELQRYLSAQPDWTVYVDGDPDCDFASVLYAVGTVRGLHANPVLLTPASRELMESDAAPPIGAKPLPPQDLRRAGNNRKGR